MRESPSSDVELEDDAHETVALVHGRRPGSPGSTSGDLEPFDRPAPLQLSFFHGLAIVVSLQIGSGIFSAPTQVSQHVPSPGVGVLVWLLGGLLVWTGAASFIELGLQIPQNGGMQEYLRECYNDFMGFLFTWTWVMVAKPSSIAIITTVFADHVCRAMLPATLVSALTIKPVALLGLVLVTTLNCLGAKVGPNLANGFLVMKIAAVASIAVAAVIALATGRADGVTKSPAGWFGSPDQQGPGDVWLVLGNLVTALFGALYCYGGWETIGFVLGDIRDSRRNLPRILNSAMSIVLVSFLLMNGALYLCRPFEVMRTSSTPVVNFGQHIFGPAGGFLYSLIIAASALGSMNANVFATAVLCVAASTRGFFPRIIANQHCSSADVEVSFYQRHTRRLPNWMRGLVIRFVRSTAILRWEKGVPIYALIFEATICAAYILLGTFNGLITFVGLSEYFFLFFSVFGIFILRARKDDAATNPPPHRTWIGNPVIFCTVSSVILVRGAISEPLQGVAIFAMILIGWLVFRFKVHGTLKS